MITQYIVYFVRILILDFFCASLLMDVVIFVKYFLVIPNIQFSNHPKINFKYIFKSGGYKISALDVERVLLTHTNITVKTLLLLFDKVVRLFLRLDLF